MNWVDKGTKNHIVQCALCVVGSFKEFILLDVEMYHLSRAPRKIIIMGSIFMGMGMNVRVDEMGLIHDIRLPATVAMVAKIIIGLIILCSSDSMISGDEFELDHIVTNLNRIE